MATLAELVNRFNSLETQFATLRAELVQYAQGNTSTIGQNPPPPPASPLYEFDMNQLLVGARQYGGGRVDPVVGPDCPHTRVMPKTGHVLSVARPDLGEMFMGYVQRVADQATGGKGDTILPSLGTLFLGTGTFFEHGTPGKPFNPDGSNWPEAADAFCNMRAYMTPDEIARDDKAKADWAEVYERMKNQPAYTPPAPQPPAPPAPPLPPGEEPL